MEKEGVLKRDGLNLFMIFVGMIFLAGLCWIADAAIGDEYSTADGWNKTYDYSDQQDYMESIAIDSDDNVYAVGYGSDTVAKTVHEYMIIKKYDSSGDEDTTNWDKVSSQDSYAYGVAVDSDDNVYVVGTYVQDNDDWDWWIRKFDSSGDEDATWNKTFYSEGWAEAYAIAIDSDDNVYVGGFGYNLVSGSSEEDWWIKKFSSDGTEDTANWNKSFNANDGWDQINFLAIDSAGNVYAVGQAVNIVTGTSNYDWWVKKFDSSGTEDTANWNKSFNSNGTNNDYLYAIDIDSDDNVYIGGVGRKVAPGSNSDDWWIKKFNPAGTEDVTYWNKTVDGGGSSDQLKVLVIDDDDNVYAAGYGHDIVSATSWRDWWIKKFNSSGTEDTTNWNWTFDYGHSSIPNFGDHISSMAFDSYGNLFVGGVLDNKGGGTDYDWGLKKLDATQVPYFRNFGGDTTNFSVEPDLSDVANPVLHTVGKAKIKWNSASVNVIDKDFDADVAIDHDGSGGFISLDISSLGAAFNTSANITIYNVDCADFRIYHTPQHVTSYYQMGRVGTIVATEENSTHLEGSGNSSVVGGDSEPYAQNINCAASTLTYTALHFDGTGGGGEPVSVPEFSDLAFLLAVLIVVGGFLAIKKQKD